MASIIIDNLKRLTRIGARSVEWGKAETTIIGGKLSDREDMSAYHLLQNLSQGVQPDDITGILNNLPDVQTAYATINTQLPDLFGDLIERRSSKKGKQSKTK